MNDEEKYLFDLRGYLVVRGALGAEEVRAANAQLDTHRMWSNQAGGLQFPQVKRYNDRIVNAGPLHQLERPLRSLIAHPALVPYLIALLGGDFRYDEGQVLLARQGAGALILHNGHTPWEYPALTYQVKDGLIYGGHVVAAICLTDARADEGGFAIVPGSHKSHYEIPEEFAAWERQSDCVVRVPVLAGDVILFADTATHGSWPWDAAFERRVAFCRYTAGMVMHTAPAPSPENSGFDEWTALERRVLRTPYAWRIDADDGGFSEIQRTAVTDGEGWTMNEYARQIINPPSGVEKGSE